MHYPQIEYPDVATLLTVAPPQRPVYCIYPQRYYRAANLFCDRFDGRVLYAVKANPHPLVLQQLVAGGIRHFDCASLEEIDAVYKVYAKARCYLMNPVRLQGCARDAWHRFGVRHFVIDHLNGLPQLLQEIPTSGAIIFARMAVHHSAAAEDLSSKFGAPPESIPTLLDAIQQSGAEPALAFNVGSGVTDPDAYRYAIDIAKAVLRRTDLPVRLVDVGGGFPHRYPGYDVPALEKFFDILDSSLSTLQGTSQREFLIEPGRALAAPGMSVLTRVQLVKEHAVYLNDGMYGSLWELRFNAHKRYSLRAWRDGRELRGGLKDFTVFGPTCDATDRLPQALALPADIRVGDFLEFGDIGAYSIGGRTSFNGFDAEAVATLTDAAAQPPRDQAHETKLR